MPPNPPYGLWHDLAASSHEDRTCAECAQNAAIKALYLLYVNVLFKLFLDLDNRVNLDTV